MFKIVRDNYFFVSVAIIFSKAKIESIWQAFEQYTHACKYSLEPEGDALWIAKAGWNLGQSRGGKSARLWLGYRPTDIRDPLTGVSKSLNAS